MWGIIYGNEDNDLFSFESQTYAFPLSLALKFWFFFGLTKFWWLLIIFLCFLTELLAVVLIILWKKIWSFSIYCRCLLYCALSSPTLRLQSIAEWTYAPHIEGSVRDLISKGGSQGRVRGFGPLPSPSHQTYGFRYYLSEIAHHHSTWSIRSVLILRYCVVIWFLGKEKFCVLGIKFEPPSLRKIPESGLNIKGFEFIIIYSTRIWRQSNWSQAGQTQCSKLVLLKENFRLLHSVVSKVISPPLRYTLLGWQYEVSRSSLAMEQILIRWDGLVRRTTKVQ